MQGWQASRGARISQPIKGTDRLGTQSERMQTIGGGEQAEVLQSVCEGVCMCAIVVADEGGEQTEVLQSVCDYAMAGGWEHLHGDIGIASCSACARPLRHHVGHGCG